MINFIFLVPGELEAKHTAHGASKRGRMDQPGKVNGSWEGCQKRTRRVEGGGNGQRPQREGKRGYGVWRSWRHRGGFDLGKSESLEDRAVEGSRDGCAILELRRFGIQSGISGLRTEWAPTVSLALGQPDRTREATRALPWWERQAQRRIRKITWVKGLEPGN